MLENYLNILLSTISESWGEPALTDFYLNDEGTGQDTSRGNRYTYGEMYGEMIRLGEMFRALGLRKGCHIAICGANSANWAVAYLAIAAFNGVVVTVLHSQTTEEIAKQIDFSDSVALFTDDDIWKELQEYNLTNIKHVISLADWSILHGEISRDHYETIARPLREMNLKEQLSDETPLDDLAMICYTSGSYGTAKGVMLSNKNISNVIVGFDQYMVYDKYRLANMLALLPISHIYGLLIETLLPLCTGCNVYISHFHMPNDIIKIASIVQPKIMFIVPSLFTYIFNGIIEDKKLLNNLDFIVTAGANMNSEIEDKLILNQIPLATGYGLTECCSCCSWQWPDYYKKSSVGRIVKGMSADISPEGEILVKGENVMLGYYKNPEATAQKIDKDGWLHTGDAGYMDEDGYLYVTGRIGQDMIVLPNGENIHPEDIENKINTLPEVKESIVVARDGKLVALVVLEQGARSKEQGSETAALKEQRRAILRIVNPQLPLYSQLYDVEFIDKPLERTAKQTIKRYLYK